MIVRFWELKPFNISINFFAWNQVNHYKYFLLGEWNFLGGWGLKALWYACDSQVFSTQANVVETSSLVGHMVSSHRVYHSSQCFTSETFSIEISVCVYWLSQLSSVVILIWQEAFIHPALVEVDNMSFLFFCLSPCSLWGTTDKTGLFGCALPWPCLAFCFQERLSFPIWEGSTDEGTSSWPSPQPLTFRTGNEGLDWTAL